MSNKRIVVTGMGMVTPLGIGRETAWQRLLAGRSGIVRLDEQVTADIPCKVGAMVPDFDAALAADPKDQKKMDRYALFALAAAQEALDQAGWHPATEDERLRTATIVASGIGGFGAVVDAVRTTDGRGPRRLSPFTVPGFLANMAASHISIRHGLRGPLGAPITACAAGAQAIGDAARLIRAGEADIAVCGGAEACVDRVSLGAFAAMRALSTGYNDDPAAASRPFDQGHDGFVMGEGAGILVIEELEHALRRGAVPIAELVGYGTSADAHHMTSPPEDGAGGRRAMALALRQAGIAASEVGHVNAHATSTPVGDAAELAAIRAVFGAAGEPAAGDPAAGEPAAGDPAAGDPAAGAPAAGDPAASAPAAGGPAPGAAVRGAPAAAGPAISATKSATGHLLGAAGGVEAIFTIQALRDQLAPPTLNLVRPDAAADGLDLVAGGPRALRTGYALSNGFGFGGVNASLLFRRWP